MSTQVKDICVRVKTISGLWETVGVDRMAGIVPEIVGDLLADEWGPATAGFNLHRDPGVTWPDLGAYGDVEIDVAGVTVWDGRISQTPSADGDDPVVNVQCEGWRQHLNDDVYRRSYVHTKLTDWKDLRAFAGEDLSRARAAPSVTVGDGLITFGWPNNTRVDTNDVVGVALDMGLWGFGPKRIVVDWEKVASFADVNMGLFAFTFGAFPSQTFSSGPTSGFPFTITGASSGVVGATFTTPRRYLALFMFYSGTGGVVGQDNIVRIKSCQVFTDTAYESGGASTLTAPTIINDALSRGTLLLSADRSGIDPNATTTFAFPEFDMDGQKTPREVIDAANSPLNYRSKIAVGRRAIFEPKPAFATIEIGEWPGSVFEDASANSGDDIYNGVIVEGAGADGSQISVARSASQRTGIVATPVTSPTPDNPSFATDTASWTPDSGTAITRDTGVFDTSPAAGRWDRSGGNLNPGDRLFETFTGTFLTGTTYLVTGSIRGTVSGAEVVLLFGVPDGGNFSFATKLLTTSFASFSFPWAPNATTSAGQFWIDVNTATKVYIDTLALAATQPTLVDRRGFKRTHVLPIKNSLTTALGTQIGDTWLAAHRTTPLKGTVRVTGSGAVRDILTGRSVAPEELLARTGDMLRLSHRVDPDTGGWGREGRIASVAYNPAEDAAVVTLDSTRTNVEGLLEQLAIVVGSS